jgi:hypothetical protein
VCRLFAYFSVDAAQIRVLGRFEIQQLGAIGRLQRRGCAIDAPSPGFSLFKIVEAFGLLSF